MGSQLGQSVYRWLITPVLLTLMLGVACEGLAFRQATPASTPNPAHVSPDEHGSSPNIADVVERVTPAVAAVITRTRNTNTTFPSDIVASGTGFFFDRRGYILTNNHVVQGAQRVDVTFTNGRTLQAEIVGIDRLTDLAVLKAAIDDPPTVPLGDSESLRVGDWVVAIGNALGLPGGPTVTVGVVSALGRSFQVGTNLTLHNLVQTDASINPGNSGGPLLNLHGEVVGINTAVLRGQLPQGGVAEGIGFAVSAETAIPVANQLMKNGRVIWPWLGINVKEVTPVVAVEENLPVKRGVLVVDVVPTGPSQKANVLPRDVIVALDGDQIETVRKLQKVLRNDHNIGDMVAVTVARGVRYMEFMVTLEEMPR